ncbi:MAG: prepilin-type N-terminal cleavage/methylation domain-containing protein [Nitrospirae bacterium]|nr:prepilin-type N-terminal cleavage/methylation domain-containing protein [Nitrospirota bacterium]
MIVKNENGFTLIELVLTIIIVIILATVVSLGLSGLSTARLNNAVNKVVGDLRYAQQLAISTQSRHGMTVDPSAAQYTIYRTPATAVPDPSNLGKNLVVIFNDYQQGQLAGVVFASATPFTTVPPACGAARSAIEFNSIGAPTDTGGTVLTCTYTLTLSYAGNPWQITIQQNTGNLTY